MAKPRGIGEFVIQLRKAGRNYNQIAKELSCSKNTVAYHCKKSGLTDIGFKLVKVSDEIVNQIFEFCLTNSVNDAVKKFGLSKSTIKKYRKKQSHIK